MHRGSVRDAGNRHLNAVNFIRQGIDEGAMLLSILASTSARFADRVTGSSDSGRPSAAQALDCLLR